MPRQNRVTPFGALIACPERGTFPGNRGVLHDASGRIVRAWQLRRWLICELEFRGRRRAVMTPGRYTELFFLDEATALAAGHRPCAECRRGRFNAFREAWALARGDPGEPPPADELDRQLHAERATPDGSKRLHGARLGELPEGVFVTRADWGSQAYLVRGGRLFAWTPGGYASAMARPGTDAVLVLTPALDRGRNPGRLLPPKSTLTARGIDSAESNR